MKIYKANYAVNKILGSFKVMIIIIIFIIMSTYLIGCGQDKPAQALKPAELSSVNEPLFLPDNPIDRAFARITEESEENLTDNVVFSYLYAVEWYHEYLFFLEELAEKAQSNYQGFQNWREIPGFTGAENKNNPVLAAAFFNKLAGFYKKMALDCYDSYVELGLGQDMPTNEDELYQYLQGMAMEETPFDFKRPDYKDIVRGFEDEWRTKYPLPFQGENCLTKSLACPLPHLLGWFYGYRRKDILAPGSPALCLSGGTFRSRLRGIATGMEMMNWQSFMKRVPEAGCLLMNC